jgi:hypothetical protein
MSSRLPVTNYLAGLLILEICKLLRHVLLEKLDGTLG